MRIKAKFHPEIQVAAFRHLLSLGYIFNLRHRKSKRGIYYWTFRMGAVGIRIHDKVLTRQFFRYKVMVEYRPSKPPMVFITKPTLDKKAPHVYKAGHLCLFKPKNWEWHDGRKFDLDLFPQVCLWLYYYEVWQQTGIWYGQEAQHDIHRVSLQN